MSMNDQELKSLLERAVEQEKEKGKVELSLEESDQDILNTLNKEMSSLFSFGINKFKSIVELGLDLNTAYMLGWYKLGLNTDWSAPKMKAWEQTLVRKGLITDQGFITEEGRRVYDIIHSQGEGEVKEYKKEKKEKKVRVETDFDRWWNTYPATDNFVYKGKIFKGSQSKKIKKELCIAKFKEIIGEGKYTADDIIRATENHLQIAKEESYRRNDNKLSFIANSERYLRERMWEGYVGAVVKETPKTTGGIDI